MGRGGRRQADAAALSEDFAQGETGPPGLGAGQQQERLRCWEDCDTAGVGVSLEMGGEPTVSPNREAVKTGIQEVMSEA